MSRTLSYCFVFVCQQGELEIKSLLLVASLKRFLCCEYELIAALPMPETQWGRPSEITLVLLQDFGVRTVQICNPIGGDYPIGNKIACFSIETVADKIIFLDSAILCLSEFHHDKRFHIPFNAKPADLRTFTTDLGHWKRVYESVGLLLPETRVFTTVSGELTPPYFNSGVIAVHRGTRFGQVWEECCHVIEANPDIQNKRPWLDQIALPLAVQKCGLEFDCLDEHFNHPTHLKPLNSQRLPLFCHYHASTVIRREPQLNRLVIELVKAYPALHEVITSHTDWPLLLKPYSLQRKRGFFPRLCNGLKLIQRLPKYPEVVITGIPRSGTSLLCHWLHQVRDCVVINEPASIFAPLASEAVPWGVARFYRELRRDILDGKPLENKLSGGQVIEDTNMLDEISNYVPSVSRVDCLLATKNTLAYLACLPQLRRAMSDAHFVACVRNPFDTVASWKTSFSHLRLVDIDKFPVRYLDGQLLSAHQRQSLLEIVATKNIAYRRALLWRYLAECILDNIQYLTLIHYEEFVCQPKRVLREILRKTNSAPPLRLLGEIHPSSPRQKRQVLDEDDLQAIHAVCNQAAAELGYRDISGSSDFAKKAL